ncbi:U6 snRNA phosphodiesterase 1 isoform X1 [Patella vulgata]|uniref:U6 snRNA phosphodiesterase 1 isoform X1 n=1 Tax=Patella vulgata TaxID=6465 RepID=UPI00217FBFFE|nr:U6 snRNA phosphodiesterase 1 isoform X1 [Patella vulgata]
MCASIVDYPSSDSTEDENESSAEPVSRPTSNASESTESTNKRKSSNEIQSPVEIKRQKIKNIKKNLLPLPDSIQTMFKDDKRHDDDNSQHGGRIRSFQHVAGNWATYVYIPFPSDERFDDFVQELMTCLQDLKFEKMSDYHVSLSRTVTIRHHWIESLTQSLKIKLMNFNRFICSTANFKFYTNDERTRTFLSLQVSDLGEKLKQLTCIVDESFQEFNLDKYYKNPSYHISIGWCLGDVLNKITDSKQSEIQDMLSKFIVENEDLSYIDVHEIKCKTGNKVFTYHMLNS